MDFDARVRMAVYGHVAATGGVPELGTVARAVGAPASDVREAYARLCRQRLLVVEPDGESVRMAPPFSGVPTQHRVRVEGRDYHANCAWDALGIPAALRRAGVVHSRCEQSGEPLRLEVSTDGPGGSEWRFHCPVPAVHWWRDIVFT